MLFMPGAANNTDRITDRMRVIAHTHGDDSIVDTIARYFTEEGGSVSATARRIGVSRNTLERWISILEIRFSHTLVSAGG